MYNYIIVSDILIHAAYVVNNCNHQKSPQSYYYLDNFSIVPYTVNLLI